MSPKPPSRTDAAAIARATEVSDILDLRKAGWTLAQIADKYNVSVSAISQRIDRALKATRNESAESLIALEAERIDELHRSWYEIALRAGELIPPGPYATPQEKRAWSQDVLTSARATEVVAKLSDVRRKLHGLDRFDQREDAKAALDAAQGKLAVELIERVMAQVGLTAEQRKLVPAAVQAAIATMQAAETIAGEIEDEE